GRRAGGRGSAVGRRAQRPDRDAQSRRARAVDRERRGDRGRDAAAVVAARRRARLRRRRGGGAGPDGGRGAMAFLSGPVRPFRRPGTFHGRRKPMMIGSRWFSLVGTLSLIAAVAGATGCVDKVNTAVLSCPCASGYVCCESGVCATEQNGCPAATAALSASVAGRWTGYVENLAGGDDAVSITIAV